MPPANVFVNNGEKKWTARRMVIVNRFIYYDSFDWLRNLNGAQATVVASGKLV